MLKSKLCGLAIAFTIGCLSYSPMAVLAADTNSESITLSENSQNQQNERASFDDMLKEASEKWDTLTDKQKAQVYSLLEKEMKAEIKMMDKLADLGVIKKEDAALLKTLMEEKLAEIRKNGEFPLARPKRTKNNK